MDAFYASVEQRDRPELLGRPVIVGADPGGRGVVSAASYEARKFGVRSAMPISQAKRLCPHAAFLRPRINYYAQVSRGIFAILRAFSPLVEPMSLDEAFVDVTGAVRAGQDAEKIALDMKARIKKETGLTASIGLAPNKFLAKIASDLRKPNGCVVVRPQEVESFLSELGVERIPGVGERGRRALGELGVRKIGELRAAPLALLRARFGVAASRLKELASGVDPTEVAVEDATKSISAETTFGTDVSEFRTVERTLIQLCDEVTSRVRRASLKARTVTVKVRYGDFRTITRSETMDKSTNLTEAITQAARNLLARKVDMAGKKVRLVGVAATNLEAAGSGQLSLFQSSDEEKLARLDRVVDKIRDRLGKDAIKKASSLEEGG